jgi:hypothetical protein
MKIIITEQQLNSKLTPIFDKYVTRMYPELLSKNTNLKMSPDETTIYIVNPQYKSFDLKNEIVAFFYDYYQTDEKHLYLDDKYISTLSTVFGEDKWAELFLNWINKQYEEKLKYMFNEISWEITAVE